MVWTALAITVVATSADVPRQSVSPVVQARASVRIMSGARVRLGEAVSSVDAARVREATVRVEGRDQPARLIEFE